MVPIGYPGPTALPRLRLGAVDGLGGEQDGHARLAGSCPRQLSMLFAKLDHGAMSFSCHGCSTIRNFEKRAARGSGIWLTRSRLKDKQRTNGYKRGAGKRQGLTSDPRGSFDSIDGKLSNIAMILN